ncbi:3-oxoacyl-[acyl-carrier-protein] synthase 3 3 [Gossypium arboreum]|uniref:3-oxoacyl-[acyl-carrier-protein] synthase 3 3 n=1 Tax=Gossypium arboreum TaxID=29729 RepID=A0A0B0PNN1_GOSAR|nr:3-oxoacyl-[acyl-carrier-protein] synthase 3 3 [Gossypium arboreum]
MCLIRLQTRPCPRLCENRAYILTWVTWRPHARVSSPCALRSGHTRPCARPCTRTCQTCRAICHLGGILTWATLPVTRPCVRPCGAY